LGRLVLALAAASAALCVQAPPATAQAAQPRARVEGDLEPALRAVIVTEVGETDRAVDNRFEARRRARDAGEAAMAVLRSEGYYAAEIETEIGEGDAPTPIVRITPGPRFLLAPAALAWVGAAPALSGQDAAQAAIQLTPGAPGRAADVVGAEGRIISALAQRGYADAAAEPREVVVDHADHTVAPTFRIAAGPLVRLDGIQLSGAVRTRRDWLRKLAPWRTGEVYRPEAVAELERRLLDAGVYDSVTVALAPASQVTPDGLRPVVVGLSERKSRTIEAGASYAAVEGLGLDVRWTRYNLLGRADTLALIGRLSNVESRAGITVALPDWRRADQTLTLDAEAYRSQTDAYDQTGATVRADATRHYGKTSYYTLGASVDLSRVDEVRVGALTPLGRDVATFAVLADAYLDRSDDPLDPKRGWRGGLRAEPTVLAGIGSLPYLRLQAQGSAYLPIGRQARTVIAGRIRLGSIFNGSVSDIPAPQRFYAGGGGSVRGFSYQGVGPRLSNGTPEGGLSLFEGSVELRQQLTRHWGVVAFVDAGDIGVTQAPALKNLAVGAGLGVRYNLSFGPIRVDLATPVARRRGAAAYQVYVSIGQSF
jgi:translocation and assembly module TamA